MSFYIRLVIQNIFWDSLAIVWPPDCKDLLHIDMFMDRFSFHLHVPKIILCAVFILLLS